MITNAIKVCVNDKYLERTFRKKQLPARCASTPSDFAWCDGALPLADDAIADTEKPAAARAFRAQTVVL